MKFKTVFSFAFFALLFVFASNAQNFQGKAVYMTKTKVDFDFGDRKIPEDAKARMLKRMQDASQKIYELNFDKTASIYKEEEKLGGPGESSRGRIFASIFGGALTGEFYKNTATKESRRAVEFFGKNFLIKEKLENFNWKLEKETKQIGKYTCFKASTVISKLKNNFSKTSDDDETQAEKEETVQVTVWYTPMIPVSMGPDEYWGLPGLILGVNAGDTQIICTKVIMNVKEKEELKAPKKGKKISKEAFDKIVYEKTLELKERFKKGRRGNGGGRPRR